jgi:hypothetical protein
MLLYVLESRLRLTPSLFVDVLRSPAGYFYEITEQHGNRYCILLDGGYFNCPNTCISSALGELADLGYKAAA